MPVIRRLSTALVSAALLGARASAVSFEWVEIGAPGNACDRQPQGCFGAVTRASAGPNGTYDQGGDVREWNETVVPDPQSRAHSEPGSR